MKAVRCLHLRGATGTVRRETYDGREHIVVPVVAMVEGVVWAVNSDVPEFVPAEELAETPQQWNGRACFADHPKDGGTQVTANTPQVLEQSFGTVFNASSRQRILETRRLELEAWLDPAKAALVGAAAMNVIARLEAGEVVEVSVGSYIEAEQKDGEFRGATYHAVWRNIVSDHLALLGKDQRGACSVAAGCGANRMAVRHLVSAEGITKEDAVEVKPRGLKERFLSLFQQLRAAGTTDNDIHRAINDALRAIVPGYMGIDDVDQTTGEVFYYAAPGDEWKMLRRSYTMTAGTATLTDNEVEVQAVTTYEPLVEPTNAEARHACSCGGRQATTTNGTGAATLITEESHMDTERIKKLAAHKHSVVKDLKVLEGMPEESVKALEDDAALKQKAEEDKAAADKVEADRLAGLSAAEPKKLTRDEIFAADASIAAIVLDHEMKAAEEKTTLVTKLAACGALTEEQLKAKSLDDLRTLAKFAKVEAPQVVHVGAPRVLSENAGVSAYEPPNPYARPAAAK